ncbi:hypothetical protein BBAD15_g1907 [Beauveria bassiana D1-5]|uniref:Uncharacterized protein n=1 Tax=Beauveria bassiana D1-5 TaxID=1245745 RepID=A0A0A2W1P4_BEABA|nr:hypothetical protein BBAD15_g1907 [Beauveria bassiana D1-5]
MPPPALPQPPADDVLVEEAGAPDLAGDKGGAKHAEEEARGVEARGGADERGEPDGEAPGEEQAEEDAARPELVTQWAGGEPEEEGGD